MSIDSGGPNTEVKQGSDRSFGLVFAAVFALIALWPLIAGHPPRWIALVLAACFCFAAAVMPQVLHPLNVVWFKFGLLLHRLISPLIMGLVFFACVTPMGLAMRLFGKDLLSLKRNVDRRSYWTIRDPPGPAPETMKKQF